MLSDFAFDQDDMREILVKYSSDLHEFLQSQVAQTPATQ